MQALRMCKSSFTSSSSLSCTNMQRVSMWHHISETTNKNIDLTWETASQA